MKTLFVIRHAKSSWKNPGMADWERPLSKRGLRDAPKMANHIASLCRKPDVIISSPARRALETAENFAEAFDYSLNKIKINEKIYEASASTLIRIIENISDKHKRVMMFGHNPGLELLVNYLSPYPLERMPTCGVVCLEFDTKKWAKACIENCSMKFFEYPKKCINS